MKFEANIPSYLKTGSGSFPVGSKSAPKAKKETNFYEQAKKGFDIPVTTVSSVPVFAPIGETERPSTNFFEDMQGTMATERRTMASGDAPKPINPFGPKPTGPVLPEEDKPFKPKPLKPIKLAEFDETTKEDVFIG